MAKGNYLPRKVFVGSRANAYLKKVSKEYNLFEKKVVDDAFEFWEKHYNKNYKITIPDKFISRSMLINKEVWDVLKEHAERRDIPVCRFFAIFIDEWMMLKK